MDKLSSLFCRCVCDIETLTTLTPGR